ncbi:MAG: phosphoribosylformylglycinamidine synthase [Prolixibacteraceae bacterium]|nr:phosphoribosylformylglycinamidine synthase [Prolixibacteraceae bacterium]MBN2649599.1 phosphoribosylformylglycinamidine synthase [Prolixibacteraceae bacterium]
MILFFHVPGGNYIAVSTKNSLSETDTEKLQWLFGEAEKIEAEKIDGWFIGPRKEMLTPWSTNAVEITQNMGIDGIFRIEEYVKVDNDKASFDPMLQHRYKGLDQQLFTIEKQPDPIIEIENIADYNQKEGLALSNEEIGYLESVSETLGRPLTDSEVFGFSQVNSEHCRHKIFNGTFIIDGEEKELSLFKLIKKTTETHPNKIVSAYKDNCSFAEGPVVEQFAPKTQDKPDFFEIKDIKTVLSLKAETHNFPTTVEPFNGAATGTGGEIRDRIAGGKGALPIAGTAVYMTAYPRLGEGREWEDKNEARPWLYQTPEEILIKASNGASDFGNKFGQPLINGSVLTFEHFENNKKFAYDKVIMLAGGIGFGKKADSLKDTPEPGEKVVLLGGDNYRIGMGGGAVSSVATGEFENKIELNAVQRANPEMQKRVFNAIRALSESDQNPIVSIHDHGAGGHLNCLSELVEDTGGVINIDQLPVGDPTLSLKEIVGNESQERMGLVIKEEYIETLRKIAERERAPMYVIGETTNDMKFTFQKLETNEKPINWKLEHMFGNPPKTIMNDQKVDAKFEAPAYSEQHIQHYIEQVLQLENVACKDWLTNKVDRSVTGRIAKQQTAGKLQLPLNNLGVIALDYKGKSGLSTSIGHAPGAALINAANGSVLSIAEALTNIIWAPLADKMTSISMSANWMWPCKNQGEDARIYDAVKAASDFAIALGINIPTGKDSCSMTQKYKNDTVLSPGTVIISTSGEVSDVRKIVEPVLVEDKALYYLDFSKAPKSIGGSAFTQILNKIGNETPTVSDPAYFLKAFNAIQELIEKELIYSGHDIGGGGLITSLLEICFSNNENGLELDLSAIGENDTVKLLFAENPGIIFQADAEVSEILKAQNIDVVKIGAPTLTGNVVLKNGNSSHSFNIKKLRDLWFKTSYLLDRNQSTSKLAKERFDNYKTNELNYNFGLFDGKASSLGIDTDRRNTSGIKAAIIREKGVNGDREMAYSLYLAGFDVKDVHMTDLISGREDLSDVSMIVFVGGFSNSDVLGSAKGWAGAFKYNEKARVALENFYKRKDTLSLGICNGCQLMVELNLVYPGMEQKPKMLHNESHKFESSFLNVNIPANNSVMLGNMEGQQLGVWVAHGEGKFSLPAGESNYNIALKYSRSNYPANPNGSDFDTAGICSADGRHLAMMPHLERAIFPWQWGYYPANRKSDEITPWVQAFVNARKWIEAI